MNPISISDAMSSRRLFAKDFVGASWNTWRTVLKATFAEPLTDDELTTFHAVAGDRSPPTHRVAEAVYVIGRSGGKDSVTALIGAHIALSFDPKAARLRGGEYVYVLCLAVDRDQAGIVFKYMRSHVEDIPVLRAMVKEIRRDSIELKNRVIIEVRTNSYRSVRGRSVLAAIFDECAFWRDENSANPDVELYGAVAPGLARVPNSMLVMISTAHKRSGLLYEHWRNYFGKDDDSVLVVRGSSTQFNPLLDQRIIDRAMAADPQLNRAEYYSEWRDDLTTFITRDLIESAIDVGVLVRPWRSGVQHHAFADVAHGRGDSFTCAIAHREGDNVVLDLVYERRAPFNPHQVVEEICKILRDYHVTLIRGDNAAADWPVEAFRKCGVQYRKCEYNRSELYLNCLPLFTAGRARLLDNGRMVSQFCGLERRTFQTGREVVNHGYGSHDDVCNSIAGALVLAAARPKRPETPIVMPFYHGVPRRIPGNAVSGNGASPLSGPPSGIHAHRDAPLARRDEPWRPFVGRYW